MARIEPFNVSNELLDQPEKLQEQARQDGYLFFRGLIDADCYLQLTSRFLGNLSSARMGTRRRSTHGRYPHGWSLYGRR